MICARSGLGLLFDGFCWMVLLERKKDLKCLFLSFDHFDESLDVQGLLLPHAESSSSRTGSRHPQRQRPREGLELHLPPIARRARHRFREAPSWLVARWHRRGGDDRVARGCLDDASGVHIDGFARQDVHQDKAGSGGHRARFHVIAANRAANDLRHQLRQEAIRDRPGGIECGHAREEVRRVKNGRGIRGLEPELD